MALLMTLMISWEKMTLEKIDVGWHIIGESSAMLALSVKTHYAGFFLVWWLFSNSEIWISGCVTCCLISLSSVWRGNTLDADRMSSGQDNRAALHHLASSWTRWHMIDGSWWRGVGRASHWSFHRIEKKRGSTFLMLGEFSQAYLFGFSPSNLFRERAKYAPSQEVSFLSLACAGKCSTQTFGNSINLLSLLWETTR